MPTYDLSHSLESGMPVYPGDPPVEIEPAATVEEDGYRTTSLDVDTHAGTHVDAPAHLLADGRTLDEYPLETFRFAARLVDLRPLAAREPIDADALYSAVDADAALEADLLAVCTGWAAHWGTDRYFEHPFLTDGAADLLVEWNCHLGIDAPNVDPTPTATARDGEPDGYPAHRVLFADGRLIVENLRALESVPCEFDVHAYPLSVRNADGSPVRAVAVVE
ncbi:cyclase family protein [Natribaculum luteum]|uniref:Cyclase family protein n=1 Tax=Natribaculum luteum TaxID=1586232 RepID=A0ABD5P2D9_9EURY|nr:cyclase family protein [Natribaculum luteum]